MIIFLCTFVHLFFYEDNEDKFLIPFLNYEIYRYFRIMDKKNNIDSEKRLPILFHIENIHYCKTFLQKIILFASKSYIKKINMIIYTFLNGLGVTQIT